MPTDEAGCKWSCESCIRGHRASLCNHFDRWMMRVKKPGRPLRDCPHATVPCTCFKERVVMVKMPKKTQNGGCMCRRAPNIDPILDNAVLRPQQQNLSGPSQPMPVSAFHASNAALQPQQPGLSSLSQPMPIPGYYPSNAVQHQPQQQDLSSPSQPMPIPGYYPSNAVHQSRQQDPSGRSQPMPIPGYYPSNAVHQSRQQDPSGRSQPMPIPGYYPSNAVHQSRQQDPSGRSQPMSFSGSKPDVLVPGPSIAQQAGVRDDIATNSVSKKKKKVAKRKLARNLRATPSRGRIVQHALQPEQHTEDSNSSDPSTPNEDNPVDYQDDSKSVAQTPSPATVQDDDPTQPVPEDSSLRPNLDQLPAQPNDTQTQPHNPAYNAELLFWNSNYGQEGHDVSTPMVSPSSKLTTQFGAAPTHHTTFDQSMRPMQSEETGHQYQNSQEACYTRDSAGLQTRAYSACPEFPIRPGCQCSADCNCPYCETHPMNQATQDCVGEMKRVLDSDDYQDWNPHLPQPEIGPGDTLTNGIYPESAAEQGHPTPVDEEALDDYPTPWGMLFNQGESVNNNDPADSFSSLMMEDDYVTAPYPLIDNPSTYPGNSTHGCGDRHTHGAN